MSGISFLQERIDGVKLQTPGDKKKLLESDHCLRSLRFELVVVLHL